MPRDKGNVVKITGTVIVLMNGNDVDAGAAGRGLAERYLAARPTAATAGR